MIDYVFIGIGVLFLAAALASMFRIVRGPSILDRMIASDMLVTTIICVLGAEMVYNNHVRSIPIMVVLAFVAVFASIMVARYVQKQTSVGRPADRSYIARRRSQ